MGFCSPTAPFFFRAACCRISTASSRTSQASYENGTLLPAASLPPNYVPYATSGGVLPDGRVLLIGGEYKLLSNNTLTLVFHKPDGDLRSEGG